jgi:hypothetical protein
MPVWEAGVYTLQASSGIRLSHFATLWNLGLEWLFTADTVSLLKKFQ